MSLTDRYVKFYSAVAEIVAQEFPNRYLGAYAYSAYALPPVKAQLHPNIVIGFVGFSYLNEETRQKKARESDREAARQFKTIEAERDEWYRQLGISWVLNVAYLRYYGY